MRKRNIWDYNITPHTDYCMVNQLNILVWGNNSVAESYGMQQLINN